MIYILWLSYLHTFSTHSQLCFSVFQVLFTSINTISSFWCWSIENETVDYFFVRIRHEAYFVATITLWGFPEEKSFVCKYLILEKILLACIRANDSAWSAEKLSPIKFVLICFKERYFCDLHLCAVSYQFRTWHVV